jgi:hypothetical protein
MTTFIVTIAMLGLFTVVGLLLERTQRRTAGLPRAPFGADLEGGRELRP